MTLRSRLVKPAADHQNEAMSSDNRLPTEAPKPLGRRARKALAVRQALFDAGLSAFEREPIARVSILDITERADVAKGVFYRHFKSKDHYLLVLWEHVQHKFLDMVRDAMLDRPPDMPPIEIVIRQFAILAQADPQTTRFWIRMMSYFPDEVGEPGHLTRIHHEYVEQLAGIFASGNPGQPTPNDIRTVVIVNSICWAMINSSLSIDNLLFDEEMVARLTTSAINALGRIGGGAA